MSKANLHVIAASNKWQVRQDGADDYAVEFNEESEAVEMAAKVAQAEGLDVFIHIGEHEIKINPESYLNAGTYGHGELYDY